MTEKKPLKDTEILAFLTERPDFFLKHPTALEALKLPKRDAGSGVAAFGSYLVEKLKTEKAEAQATAKELVEISRLNMNNVERIHKAVLRILEARNFLQFIQFLTTDCATLLDVDVIALVVNSNDTLEPKMVSAGVRMVPNGTVEKWMGSNTHILQGDIRGEEAIYGTSSRLVRSQAVFRIDIARETPPALLAFGSRDPDMFEATGGVELVNFLVRVVERCFRLWLSDAV